METDAGDIFEELNVWTDHEIQQLLSIIDVMNLADDLTAEKFVPTAINVIKNGLSIAGYHKSLEQIESVLVSLRVAYINSRGAHSHGIENDMCPYYDSLERIWSSCINSKLYKENKGRVDKKIDVANIYTSQSSHGEISNQKSPPWSDDETVELLNLIDEMNLTADFRHRLSPSTIKKLVIPLANRGYARTCNQIIGQMRRMRDSYLRCVRTGRTSQAHRNCPFFDTIDQMFQGLLRTNDLRLLQPIDHDYENKCNLSISPVNTDVRKLDDSVPTWPPIQSLPDNGGTSCQSPEPSPNDKTVQNCIKEELVVNSHEDSNSNGCDNNSISIENNLDAYPNSSTYCQPVDVNDNESHAGRYHMTAANVDKKKLKTRMFRSGIPKYIRIVKGKSKYILRKIDPPSYMKSIPTACKRPRSPIEEPNLQSIKLSPIDTDKSASPVRITMMKTFKNSAASHGKSPIVLNSTCSQTDSATTDYLTSATMKAIMEQIFNHQEQMQQQHHEWMEKQFEIQRDHDCEQRQLLLDELREFRKELRDVTEQLFTG